MLYIIHKYKLQQLIIIIDKVRTVSNNFRSMISFLLRL